MSPAALILVSVISATILVTTVLVLLWHGIRRSRSRPLRMTFIALAAITVVLSPGAVDLALDLGNRTEGLGRAFIHVGWAVGFTPAVIGLFVMWALQRRSLSIKSSPAPRSARG